MLLTDTAAQGDMSSMLPQLGLLAVLAVVFVFTVIMPQKKREKELEKEQKRKEKEAKKEQKRREKELKKEQKRKEKEAKEKAKAA